MHAQRSFPRPRSCSQAEQQGLSASFIVSQGSGSAWGPLAAQGRRLGASAGILRHASVDALALQRAARDAEGPPVGAKRVAFSVPTSPRHHAAAVRPAPLNLHGLSSRLQVHQREQQRPQLSPVMEALLSGRTTQLSPAPEAGQQGGAAELAADDLADLGTFSRWGA